MVSVVCPDSVGAEWHPVASLYYCPECLCVKCPARVLEQVAVVYCPSCMFEVPSVSVKSERGLYII
jgi:dynactin-4